MLPVTCDSRLYCMLSSFNCLYIQNLADVLITRLRQYRWNKLPAGLSHRLIQEFHHDQLEQVNRAPLARLSHLRHLYDRGLPEHRYDINIRRSTVDIITFSEADLNQLAN